MNTIDLLKAANHWREDTMNSETVVKDNEVSVVLRALGLLNDAVNLTIDDQTRLENVTARLRVRQANLRA